MSQVTHDPKLARVMIWMGYGASIIVGLILWPRLLEWGFYMENRNFGLAIIFGWFCVPVSIAAAWGVGILFMKLSRSFDPAISPYRLNRNIQTAGVLGIIATLGSCGMISSGYEPPEPLHSIYDVQLKK